MSSGDHATPIPWPTSEDRSVQTPSSSLRLEDSCGFASFGSPEDSPGDEVVREICKAMLRLCGEDVGCEAVNGEHMCKPVLRLDAPRFAVADSRVMNDGVKASKRVNLICDRTHLLQTGEITSGDGFSRGSLRCVASARWTLRACKTTEWPCSTNSCAAIRPSPSEDPVMKMRLSFVFLRPAPEEQPAAWCRLFVNHSVLIQNRSSLH